jgi:3-oxoacyl-[acyl-carrier protein] reductase
MSTILITGASSGIGAAIAQALAPRHRLILVARRRDRLEAMARGLGATIVVADLATAEGLATAAAAVDGPLHALINNAGVFALNGTGTIDRAHLDPLWRINVDAPMLLTAALLPRIARGGFVINISSTVVEQTFARCAAYTASKCALEGWSRVLREELRPRSIRVGVVVPGATDTEIWPADFAKANRSRMVRSADVAAAVRLMLEAPEATSFDRIAVTPGSGAV